MRKCVKRKCRNEVRGPVVGKGPGALTSLLPEAQRARPHQGGIREDSFCCKQGEKKGKDT